MKKIYRFNISRKHQRIILVFMSAFFLWLVVKMQRNYSSRIKVPLQVVAVPQDSIIKYRMPKSIELSVIGSGYNLMRMGLYEPKAEIDCSGIIDSVYINAQSPWFTLITGTGLKLTPQQLVSPKKLQIVLEKKISRLVKIIPEIEVKTPTGYLVTSIKSIPDTIRLSGPVSLMGELKEITTERKSYSERNLPFSDELELKLPGKYYAELDVKKVKVNVDVQQLGEVVLTNIPIEIRNVPRYRQVIPLPSEVKLIIRGGTGILAQLKARDFSVYINFDEYHLNKKIKAHVEYNKNVKSVQIEPNEFDLIIVRR